MSGIIEKLKRQCKILDEANQVLLNERAQIEHKVREVHSVANDEEGATEDHGLMGNLCCIHGRLNSLAKQQKEKTA